MTKTKCTTGSVANTPKPTPTKTTETDISVRDDADSSAIYFTGGKVYYNKSGGFAYIELGAKPAPTPSPKRLDDDTGQDPDDCA